MLQNQSPTPFYDGKYLEIPRPPFQPYQRGAMDVRHVCLMRSILEFRFECSLEIGCFEGFSTLAFLDAQDAGHLDELHVCDIERRAHLDDLFRRRGTLSYFHESRSVDFLEKWNFEEESFDFVFVDGCHEQAVVRAETELLLRRIAPIVVMAHDTNSEAMSYHGCDGPQFLKQAFQTEPGYYCLEDNRPRPGEATVRGLFFATRDLEVYEHAQKCFAFWDAAVIEARFK